jgi:hypothetical protein
VVRPALFAGLLALSCAAYAPSLFLPFISDDYVHIAVARVLGEPSGWERLLNDPLYRFRAISSIQAYATERLFGLNPLAFNLSGLLLHFLCTCLVVALGYWRAIGWRVAIPAAAFFAVAEGHQEAVIWYASVPELHVFALTLLSFLCWLAWFQSEQRSARWYAWSCCAFILALFAKESAVCLVGLQGLAILASARRRSVRDWVSTLPFAMLSVAYFLVLFSTRANHQHFNDGTFSLAAPFWITITNSLGRLLWIWGAIGIAILWSLRRRAALPLIGVALAWAIVTLLPYSFLTYMPRVPSRHTYLASVATALLFGGAVAALLASGRRYARPVTAALVLLMVVHNCTYLWTRKHRQYVERASPTEALLEVARKSEGKIVVECFPFPLNIASDAVRIGASQDPARLEFRIASDCAVGSYRYRLVGNEIAGDRGSL